MSERIEFEESSGPVFATRKRGESLRAHFQLDELDTKDTIEVIFPESTLAITSSFFLGMFGSSVVRCGTKESFEEKYQFEVPEYVKDDVEDGIIRALRKRPESIIGS